MAKNKQAGKTATQKAQGTGEDQQLNDQSNVDVNTTQSLESTETSPQNTLNLGEGESAGNGETTQKVVPDAPQKASIPAKRESKAMQRFREIANDYAKHYPNNKSFHFCSDGQVFLGRDFAEATTRQNELDSTETVITIEIE